MITRIAVVAVAGLLASCSMCEPGPVTQPGAPVVAPPEPAASTLPSDEEDTVVSPFAEPPPLARVDAPTPEQSSAFAAASNALAFDLYGRVRGERGNLVFSPASIELALAMTWAGARGETAEEMKRVLHVEVEPDALHDAASRILASWNDPSRETYELHVANRLFGQASFAFEEPYLDLVRDRYRAPLERMDFAGAFDAERVRINTWVESQTERRIQNLLAPGTISADTRLVLVNAVYFLGKWLHPFEDWATRDERFHPAAGAPINVRTMHQVESLRYVEDAAVQVLELPYEGDDLAMMIVLPRARTGLGAVEARLDAAAVARWAGALGSRDVDVALPKFEIADAEIPLTDLLRAMGMSLAFDAAQADFTGIANGPTPWDRVAISHVIHRAFVKVDEVGTEAAAATAVAMVAGAAPPQPSDPPVVFRADHPFLFLIRDVRSGSVLFLGRMEDPR